MLKTNRTRLGLLTLITLGSCSQSNKSTEVSGGEFAAGLLSQKLVGVLTNNAQLPLPSYNPVGLTLPAGGPVNVVEQLPCAPTMGATHPDQITGCNGNNLIQADLPTTGLSLIHNSNGADEIPDISNPNPRNLNFGFGAGFTLSVDDRFVIITPNVEAIKYLGDGTAIRFRALNGTYVPMDKRLDESTIVVSSGGVTETYVNGTVRTYAPLAIDPSQYVLKRIKFRSCSTTTFAHTNDGQIASISDTDGGQIQFSYSGKFLSTIKDNAGGIYQFSFDNLGRLTSILYPDGQRNWKFSYQNKSGKVTGSQSAGGKILEYSYYFNALKSITNKLGYITTLEYTPTKFTMRTSKDFESHTFGNGVVISSVHSSYNTNPSLATTTYTREPGPSFRLAAITNPLGDKTTFSYLSQEETRPSTINYPRGGGSVSYIGNGPGAFIGPVRGINSKQGNVVVEETYNPEGNFGQITKRKVTNTTGSAADVTTYSYDAAGNLKNTIRNGVVTSSATYNAKCEPISKTNVAGVTTTMAWNADGTLASVTDHVGRRTSYTYDALGNITHVLKPSGIKNEFTYSALSERDSSLTANSSGGGGSIQSNTSRSFGSDSSPTGAVSTFSISGETQWTRSTSYDTSTLNPGARVSDSVRNSAGANRNLVK